jgi:hypothetical protein
MPPRQHGQAVQELLGLETPPIPESGGGNPEALLHGGVDRVSPLLGFEIAEIAEESARSADVATLAPCAATEAPLECAGRFVDSFAARAFRRPLEAGERERILVVFTSGSEGGTYEEGIRLVIEAVLQMPSFLYRRQLGRDLEDGFYELDSYEIASELGLLLRDGLPDEELMLAASRDELRTNEGIEAQVDRLLAIPEVRANVREALLRWLELPRLAHAVRADAEFDEALRTSMQTETELFVDDVLANRGGSLHELLGSRTTFVDERLAPLYGITYPAGSTGFVEMEVPHRVGILSHASWLTSFSGVSEPSVVKRGIFVARHLLCKYIPPPNPLAILDARPALEALTTERARAEYRAGRADCGACHQYFDPFGVLFERYDALGRHRVEIDGMPIDSSWMVGDPPSIAGFYEDAEALLPELATSEEVLFCAARELTAAAIDAPIEDADRCLVEPMLEALTASNGDVFALLKAIALSDAFRIRREAP